MANRDIKNGCKYPYDGRKPKDAAERIVLGILYDLSDRAGIKQALLDVDENVRESLVNDLAKIVRDGIKESNKE